jgi:hypothetical protein
MRERGTQNHLIRRTSSAAKPEDLTRSTTPRRIILPCDNGSGFASGAWGGVPAARSNLQNSRNDIDDCTTEQKNNQRNSEPSRTIFTLRKFLLMLNYIILEAKQRLPENYWKMNRIMIKIRTFSGPISRVPWWQDRWSDGNPEAAIG